MISRRVFSAIAGASLLTPVSAFAQSAEPPGDPRLASHPQLADALAHLNARRWPELAALVRSNPPDSACVLLSDLGDQSEVDVDLSGIEAEPMGRTIAGALMTDWGWRYRGSGVGATVTQAMGQAFATRLQTARTHLEAAIVADRQDGVAYARLIRVVKGLSRPDAIETIWPAFLEVDAARKPVRAFSGLEDLLAAKWFGSHDIMLGFAANNQHALEPASYGLVAQAVNEIMLAIMRERGSEGATAFVNQPPVANLVNTANAAFNALPPPSDFYQANFAYGEFSFLYAMFGLGELARPHLSAMGQSISGPWTLLEDPFQAVEAARGQAGLGAI